ncbi:MAG: RNA polymerase sigma factor [Hyphomicrobiales bacterium]|nr:RNA polymerase sigma factor [Hyphomicrobiales bacterium]
MDDIAAALEPEIPRLRRFAYALTRDRAAADDLVQDTLERALSRWQVRRRQSSLRAWLFAILRNLFLDSLRQRGRRGAHVGLEALQHMPAEGDMQHAGEGLRDVIAGLERLSEEQRSVLLLVAVEELSYEEAAAVLGVPAGTVMSRLGRAREKMRAFMKHGRDNVLRVVK